MFYAVVIVIRDVIKFYAVVIRDVIKVLRRVELVSKVSLAYQLSLWQLYMQILYSQVL